MPAFFKHNSSFIATVNCISIPPKALFEGKAQPWRLGKNFGDPKFAVSENGEGFQRELEGCVVQPAQKADRFVTKELMNNLFNSKKVSQLNKVNLQGEILTGFFDRIPCSALLFRKRMCQRRRAFLMKLNNLFTNNLYVVVQTIRGNKGLASPPPQFLALIEANPSSSKICGKNFDKLQSST